MKCSHSYFSTEGPGITKRYCRCISLSNTVRFSLICPAIGTARNDWPSAFNKDSKNLPVYPPPRNRAVDSPPSFVMALATFTPPPPGSKAGGLQYIFFSAFSVFTMVLLSMAGFRVMVIIGSIFIMFITVRLIHFVHIIATFEAIFISDSGIFSHFILFFKRQVIRTGGFQPAIIPFTEYLGGQAKPPKKTGLHFGYCLVFAYIYPPPFLLRLRFPDGGTVPQFLF